MITACVLYLAGFSSFLFLPGVSEGFQLAADVRVCWRFQGWFLGFTKLLQVSSVFWRVFEGVL